MNDQRSAILKFLSYEFPKLGKKIDDKYDRVMLNEWKVIFIVVRSSYAVRIP